MITIFVRFQLKYVILTQPLMYNENENDKEAESLEGLQLYLRNATRVDKLARLSFSCSLDLLLISIKQI